MKNEIRKKTIILLSIWVIILLLVPLLTIIIEDKLSSKTSSYISSDFDIQDYDVTLEVDKNNKIDVTEKITVNIPDKDFNGIYKGIPTWQEYYDSKGKLQKKKIKITNVRVIGEKYKLEEYNNKINIKVGSERFKADQGLKTYTIKYRYDMGNDDNKGYDELAFNLFSNYDNTKIKNMHVTINMPDKFEDKIKLLKDNKDITDKIDYTITDNRIEMTLKDYVLDDKATLILPLKDNYFYGSTSNYGILSLLISIVIIIMSIISFIAWKKYSKKKDISIPTIEFYAPDDLDAAEIGYVNGETSIKKLVTATLIGLASKGYIDIIKENDKYKLVNSKIVEKSLTISEQIIYQELFVDSDEVYTTDAKMSTICSKVKQILESTLNKKYVDNTTKSMLRIVFILLVISIVSWMVSYLFIKDLNPRLNIIYIISFIAIFITGFVSIFMNYKTDYYELLKAKIKGFKEYLETAEKNNLDTLVLNDPSYFYNIIPYTYVLNVSNKWIKEFEKQNVVNIPSENIYDNDVFLILD